MPTEPSGPASPAGPGGELKIVVGLGNPGAEYRRTRHNLGFLVVEAFASTLALGRPRRRFRSRLYEGQANGGRIVLLQPQTYMNLSGPAVRDAVSFLLPERVGEDDVDFADTLLVVYDDLALPPGKLRFRRRGSSGGHRGVASTIDALGTERFSRLKIGIGHPGAEPEAPAVEDYVLEPLAGEDAQSLVETARVAASTLSVWLSEGIDVCSERFNATGGIGAESAGLGERQPAEPAPNGEHDDGR